MIADSDFAEAARNELARLEPFGYDEIRQDTGPGFVTFTVVRDATFVHLGREIRDQFIYCELGRLRDGVLPGWGAGDRMNVRLLMPAPGDLGSYEETPASLKKVVRDVVDAAIEYGVPYLNGLR